MNSDGTLIIAKNQLSGGTLLTLDIANELKKPVLVFVPEKHTETKAGIQLIHNWINENNISVLNVAGPRKSEWDKGYDFAFRTISELIR